MILFLAGTSDARELAVCLKEEGFDLIATVVTDNGARELYNHGLNVKVGRMTDEEITSFIQRNSIKLVIDASHPYAEEASKNAINGAKKANVPYIRYEREQQTFSQEKLIFAGNYTDAAQLASEKKGVIMLTTGSKTLQIFSEKLLHLEETRVLVRMLPRKDNMEKCEELNFPQKNIIAIQGPFSKEFNKALFEQYGVTLMITKESGRAGSVDEKIEAALELGIEIIIIRRPKIQYGLQYSTFDEIISHAKKERETWIF